MDIYKIRKNIRTDKKVAFYAEGRSSILLLESILISNGCRWRGLNNRNSIFRDHSLTSPRFNRLCIFINSEGNEPKHLSYASIPNDLSNTVFVSKFTVNELNDLFINIPTYKPKKIERVI